MHLHMTWNACIQMHISSSRSPIRIFKQIRFMTAHSKRQALKEFVSNSHICKHLQDSTT